MNKLKTEMKETKTYVPSGHPVMEKFPAKISSEDELLEYFNPLAEQFLSTGVKEIDMSRDFAWIYFKDTINMNSDMFIRFCAQMFKNTGYMFGRGDSSNNRIVIVHHTNTDHWK